MAERRWGAVTRVSKSGSGAPEVAVEDEHGSGDWPAEDDFAVAVDAFVSEDAMCAFFNPVDSG
jgi:hypothetical protein